MLCLIGGSTTAWAQTGSGPLDRFARNLAAGRDVTRFLADDERALADRFGIRYDGATTKALIGVEPDSETLVGLKTGALHLVTTRLDNADGAFRLTIPGTAYDHTVYLDGDRVRTPVVQLTRRWPVHQTRFLDVRAADSTGWNPSLGAALDSFVTHTMTALGYTAAQRTLVETRRIGYVRCADEAEVERLTGYVTRGVALLGPDLVVSSHPAHLHELTHELVSIRLGRTALYTHPLLQEGLAVALGGRAGGVPEAQLSMGAFLVRAGMLTPAELFTRAGFAEQNASLSYPVAGLYVRFLLDRLGADRTLALYRRFSAPTAGAVPDLAPADLPPDADWHRWLARFTPYAHATLGLDRPLPTGETVQLDGNRLDIAMPTGALLIKISDEPGGDGSRLLATKLPGIPSDGAAYLVTADSTEINLYDLRTDLWIAGYVRAFTAAGPAVLTVPDGRLSFSLLLDRPPTGRVSARWLSTTPN